jgi:hypothetical protein
LGHRLYSGRFKNGNSRKVGIVTIRIPGLDARAMGAMFLFLAALLSAPAEPATIAAGSIKRFGVVSVIADKFARSYIGLTAFTNKVEEIDVTAWDIDAAYADQLGKVAAGLLSVSAGYLC